MGIIFGIYMLAGIVVGLGIFVILVGVANLVLSVTRRRRGGGQGPVYAIFMAVLLTVLVIGVYCYPLLPDILPNTSPGSNYDIASKNLFFYCLAYSVSLGGAVLFASVVTFVIGRVIQL